MSSVDLGLEFAADDWFRVEQAWIAWWARDLKRPLIVIEGLTPGASISITNVHHLGVPAAHLPLEQPAGEVLDYYQESLKAKRFYGDACPKWWPNFGPGIVAGFLGAQVKSTPETVWFEPAHHMNIQDLQLVHAADNVWWQRVQELTRLAVDRWGDQVCVAHTDLGGNLDILASLLGTERLLFALHDHPNKVKHLIGELTTVWLGYHDDLYNIIRKGERGTTPWATIWSPGRCYMLQCDFAAMISPRMFERYALPDLAACCQALDHSFYHMDGKGQIPHLDLLLTLDGLDGIQWIPGAGEPPPEEWIPLLRRIRDGEKLCQLYVSPEGARTIAQELGGQGFCFYIDQAMSQAEAESFLASFPSRW
jgi:5-methyltetrahydrofolate--homocysteine methyltransferase